MNSFSLLDIDDLSNEQIQGFFTRAKQIKTQGFSVSSQFGGKICTQLFFEPSTRTRLSFEMACKRMGISTINFDSAGSSLMKGETLLDTFLNVQAMKPDLMVLRFGEDKDLSAAIKSSPIPVISGGEGKYSHPSQALLDAFTILEERGQLNGEKVLIVGDVGHSRVAASNIKLLTRFGAKVAIAGPDYLTELPKDLETKVTRFSDLREGMKWANVVMALRVQLERMASGTKTQFSPERYAREFGIHQGQLSWLNKDAILLHPGPVNQGVELDWPAMQHSQSRILQQVENGVYIRSAMIERCLS